MTRHLQLIEGGLDDSWMERGSCKAYSLRLFFPEEHTPATVIREAKRVCTGCPVRVQCLNYALDNHIVHGIWGGETVRQRRASAARRRGAA